MSQTQSELVDIPFNDWSIEQLYSNNKTATTRTDRYGLPGERFKAAEEVWEFTHVVRVPLQVVANHFYSEEGCMSKEDFIDIWEDIHYRKGYEPDWMVWLHLFREDSA